MLRIRTTDSPTLIRGILALCLVGSSGGIVEDVTAEDKKPFTPAEVQFFHEKNPVYFFSDHLTGAHYYKFLPDGKYVVIAKEHLGVWPIDQGTWSQAKDGVITLVSPKWCADVVCGPLSIQVARKSNAELLPELLSKINELLGSHKSEKFAREDLEELKAGDTVVEEAKFPIEIQTDWKDSYSRGDVIELARSIEGFLKNPDLQNTKMVALAYRGKVFLNSLNQVTNRDQVSVCQAIDRGEGPGDMDIYNPFMINEKQFSEGTGTPYPFKYFPELNAVTGAK